MNYFLGVLFAVLSGFCNFGGQILQKKAINDVLKADGKLDMKVLVKKPLWISGLLLIILINTVLLAFAQMYIGPALIPGLLASGFIVLGIGSVKLLGEKLTKVEIMAIAVLIVAIVLISMSKLSIDADLTRFNDSGFVIRIIIFSIIFTLLWFALFYGGKRKKNKAVLMALGAGFPFIMNNVWMQPLFLSMTSLLSGEMVKLSLIVFFPSAAIMAYVNFMGIVHLQKAMAEGNASIVIPIQQIPQQVSPIIIYFLIYNLSAPSSYSYVFLLTGIAMIIFAGFILSKRQTKLEKMTNVDTN